jgi:hypothetical protein
MAITIESGVPLPAPRSSYPWTEMRVGDSLLAEDTKSLRSLATLAGKRHGLKFTIRKEGTKLRVWRIRNGGGA